MVRATSAQIRHEQPQTVRRLSHLSHVMRQPMQLTLPGVTTVGDAALESIYRILQARGGQRESLA